MRILPRPRNPYYYAVPVEIMKEFRAIGVMAIVIYEYAICADGQLMSYPLQEIWSFVARYRANA
jgi:hypothetical protein